MRVTADLESSIMFNNFTSADKKSVLIPALIIAPTVMRNGNPAFLHLDKIIVYLRQT